MGSMAYKAISSVGLWRQCHGTQLLEGASVMATLTPIKPSGNKPTPARLVLLLLCEMDPKGSIGSISLSI